MRNTLFILKVDVCHITKNLPHHDTNIFLIVCNNWCCVLTYQVFLWLVATWSPRIYTEFYWCSITILNHPSCKLLMSGLVWFPSFVIDWGSEFPNIRLQRGRLECQSHKTHHFRETPAHSFMKTRKLENIYI